MNEILQQKLNIFTDWVKDSRKIVFFGGAGVSTESGIPDFRSEDGLYAQHYKYPPEYMLSHDCFVEHTAEFFDFYRAKMLPTGISPNVTHEVLASLEESGKLTAVVTQNIDGLHQMAGSQNVLELHGSTLRNFCTRCGKFHGVDFMRESDGIPTCECGGVVKPDVVLYGEGLNSSTVGRSMEAISGADMLIVGGTSLAVYPAAGLIDYYRGNRLVLVNLAQTSKDSDANLVINAKLGEVFTHLKGSGKENQWQTLKSPRTSNN